MKTTTKLGSVFSCDICNNAYSKNEELISHMEKHKDEFVVLSDPKFFDLTNTELEKTIVGEDKSRRAILLSCNSINVDGAQLNTCITDESSVGKSWVAKKITEIFHENRVQYRTKITPQAFTYWHDPKSEPDWTWDGKICYLEDIGNQLLNCDPFKLMASEGSKATIVVNQKAVDIEIKGKPMLLITTASSVPNMEVANRFNFISLDHGEEQTRAILRRIGNSKAEKKENQYDKQITNAISCLKRVVVAIPYMPKIAEKYPNKFIRARRDFTRLANLIESSASFFQHQRKRNDDGVVLADKQDYELAKEAFAVISPSTQHGLTYKLKKSFEACKEMVNNGRLEEKPFTAQEIAAKFPILSQSNWYDHLDKLAEKGLLSIELVERGDRKKETRVFSLSGTLSAIELPEFDDL